MEREFGAVYSENRRLDEKISSFKDEVVTKVDSLERRFDFQGPRNPCKPRSRTRSEIPEGLTFRSQLSPLRYQLPKLGIEGPYCFNTDSNCEFAAIPVEPADSLSFTNLSL